MFKKLIKGAINSGWNLAVGALGAAIGNAIYEIGRYVVYETILKEKDEDYEEEVTISGELEERRES